MNKEIKNILQCWHSSLSRFGKIDSWNVVENLSIIGNYLLKKEDSSSMRSSVKSIRDSVISGSYYPQSLLHSIERILTLENKKAELPLSPFIKKKGNRVLLGGQDVRFKSETRKIFEEKLKFKKGMMLRNFDIETESHVDGRKVRRIVEKKMCQAYHRMHRKDEAYKTSNSERYWMQRATSFQLYNIGQKEQIKGTSRGLSTHWKKQYDPLTGMYVFKKKMAYKDKTAALKAISLWKINHPNDHREISTYRCAECGKWHIGHRSRIVKSLSAFISDFDNLALA